MKLHLDRQIWKDLRIFVKCNFTVVFLWLCWCSIGIISVITNKSFLNVFPHPLTASTSQLLHTFVLTYLSTFFINNGPRSPCMMGLGKHHKHFLLLVLLNIASIVGFHTGVSLISAAYVQLGKSFMFLVTLLVK